MHIWGKIIGFCFGYMFARFPGAILGVIVGHLFDKQYSKAFSGVGGFSGLLRNKNALKSRALFFYTLFSIMGHIAKSSGRVTKADIELATLLMAKLNLNKELKKEAQAAYTEGKKSDFPITEVVSEFKRFCAGQKEFIRMYLEIQIQAAVINGEIHPKAKQVLNQIAKVLGYTTEELEALIQQCMASAHFSSGEQSNHYQQPTAIQLNNAYQIIGITKDTPEKESKKAYKKLMSQHHPDKLSAQGLPEQALLLAKEKTQEIQAAWTLIKQHNTW
ncbi:co-chaperone DjlA [Algibacillus agarilyticus]|uniref:co-chaperone DjlA n=1 Tax=Algibacillus agarilyticus TaxID=2234133 RepID=UPI000DD09A2B|nr:co-chaperone DjlA [Algibacillus agarilyticus]